ncbi:hypothetical protein K2173_005663 [Erythroxylum novogranatense]|uniref:Chromo domain-containing protein n=1 Tax=Erythroxylum novogranatense TaxID=1862640 RepID=A0AAV8SQF1_9ROSI|nr:hypothetical protein K2173_005663 [Erythroxylum novogranatense]
MGFDFTIEYKGGKENVIVDALSRKEESGEGEGHMMAVSVPIPNWIDTIKEETCSNLDLKTLVSMVLEGEALGPWEYKDGIIYFKGRIYLAESSPLIHDIIFQFHNSTHEGFLKTTQRIRSTFYWKGLKRRIHISMDFLDGLTSLRGKSTIFVVVDRLSKYAHFMAISHPYTAVSVAQVFFDNIFRLYGLPKSIYCYNTGVHSSTEKTPFEVVYCRPPPTLLSYIPGMAKVATVEQELLERDVMIKEIREKNQQAQNSMKRIYDAKHQEREFEIGYWLSPRYYGSFKVLQRIGAVAYKLDLPKNSRIHPIFHVSLLKKYVGSRVIIQSKSPVGDEEIGTLISEPEAILNRRSRRRKLEVLIQWRGLSTADATWEDFNSIKFKFPHVTLKDKSGF